MAPKGAMPRLKELRATWTEVDREQPMLKLLIPVVVLAWLLERFLVPFSNWVPLVAAVWLALEFSRVRTRAAVDRLNRKWERFHLSNALATAPETTQWLNKLLQTVWPNYLEPRLVQEYLRIVQKQLREKRPKSIQSIEVEEFSLGTAPPQMGSTKTYWSNDATGKVSLYMDFLFDTTDMSVVLGAKLAGPLKGRAVRLIVSHVFVKGQLKFIPILDGQAVLYSFADPPEVHVGVAVAGGSSSLSLSDLPGVATWLERLLLEALVKTMLEPRRRIRTLPLRNLHKHAVSGVLQVTVVSASGLQSLTPAGSQGTWLTKRKSDAESQSASAPPSPYVELSVGGLARKTRVERATLEPLWDETMELPLHGSLSTLYVRAYDAGERNVRQAPMGEADLKIQYVADDSTIFYAVGRDEAVIAHRAECCEKGVVVTLPLLDSASGEVTLRLTMKEWHFAESAPATAVPAVPSMSRIDSVSLLTGRTIRVTVVGARELKPADYSGFSDPYVKLQYGSITRKTKTVAQNLNPIWNETFEFKELSGGEHLRLRVFDSDKLQMDQSLGVARVNLLNLVEGMQREVWVPLEKANTGEVRLQLEVLGKDYDLAREADAVAASNAHVSTVTKSEGPATIEVTLVEARNLKAADWNGTSDPYVSVKYGAVKQRSKVIYKTLTPQWHQTLEFKDSGAKHLALHVKDYNTVMSSTSIGHCQVSLEGLEDNATRDIWATLTGVKKGEIHLQITRRVATKVVSTEAVKPPLEKLAPEVIAASKLQIQTDKMYALLQQALALTSDEELKTVLGELEQAEEERGGIVAQLEKDRNTLVAKIKEFEQVIIAHGGFASVMRAQADRDVLVAKVKQLEDAMSGL